MHMHLNLKVSKTAFLQLLINNLQNLSQKLQIRNKFKCGIKHWNKQNKAINKQIHLDYI